MKNILWKEGMKYWWSVLLVFFFHVFLRVHSINMYSSLSLSLALSLCGCLHTAEFVSQGVCCISTRWHLRDFFTRWEYGSFNCCLSSVSGTVIQPYGVYISGYLCIFVCVRKRHKYKFPESISYSSTWLYYAIFSLLMRSLQQGLRPMFSGTNYIQVW